MGSDNVGARIVHLIAVGGAFVVPGWLAMNRGDTIDADVCIMRRVGARYLSRCAADARLARGDKSRQWRGLVGVGNEACEIWKRAAHGVNPIWRQLGKRDDVSAFSARKSSDHIE